MSVLVTGAAGFIGVTLRAARPGRPGVVGVRRLHHVLRAAPQLANIAHLAKDPHFEFAEGDLLDVLLDEGAGRRGRHRPPRRGASASTCGSLFARYVDRNVMATHRLLEAAVDHGVGRRRLRVQLLRLRWRGERPAGSG